MNYNKELESYEFKVAEQKFIPSKENVEKIKITLKFEYNGENYEITPPAFSPKQLKNGQWEKQACIYIDNKVKKIEGKTSDNIPDLKGEKIENSGYDNTGPKNTKRYPER